MLSAGPRRGTGILRWPGVAVIGLAALTLAELTKGPEFDIPIMRGRAPVLLIGAALGLAAAVCLISRTGRRVLVLLVIPCVPYAGYLYGGPAWWPAAVTAAELLLPVLLATFIAMTLIRARSAPREQTAPPPDPPQGPHPAG
jgi:hypothetical protein